MNANVQDLTNTVLEDKELVSMLEQSADANEVSELLAKKGIKIEAKTIDAFMEQQVGQGELSESELENVAGGKFKLSYYKGYVRLTVRAADLETR